LGALYFIELVVLVISAYPLFKFLGTSGVIIWVLLFLVGQKTAYTIEKFKKNNDIQSYKEIIAFCEGKSMIQ